MQGWRTLWRTGTRSWMETNVLKTQMFSATAVAATKKPPSAWPDVSTTWRAFVAQMSPNIWARSEYIITVVDTNQTRRDVSTKKVYISLCNPDLTGQYLKGRVTDRMRNIAWNRTDLILSDIAVILKSIINNFFKHSAQPYMVLHYQFLCHREILKDENSAYFGFHAEVSLALSEGIWSVSDLKSAA